MQRRWRGAESLGAVPDRADVNVRGHALGCRVRGSQHPHHTPIPAAEVQDLVRIGCADSQLDQTDGAEGGPPRIEVISLMALNRLGGAGPSRRSANLM
jgi:hypothetical protein